MAANNGVDPVSTIAGFRAFRATEPNWEPRLGENWMFVERIANSNTATLAHYHYRYDDKEEVRHTRDVVLKIQYRHPLAELGNRPNGYPDDYASLRCESEWLKELSGLDLRNGLEWDLYEDPRRPKGIVRQYASQWVGKRNPRGRNEVLFLEYCPGVEWKERQWYNLEVFDREDIVLDEVDIWIIFKQFTRMIMMLDNGNEIPFEKDTLGSRQPLWKTDEICHYNIEPRNSKFSYSNLRHGF